ncbi:hypothetical protein DERF_006263 [Dermatophagoides farinae]|uniref:Uncharacterized protein n=1 Tax=Dermatophagoides farinae TaxID=6954 RepID=A0A922L7I4_DERFA|nr:hypothetical protein DERF_006263 [Dermatophagoides farinae]
MEQLQLLSSLSISDIKKFDGTNFKFWLDEIKLWCDGCGFSDLLEITSIKNVNADKKKKLKMLRARILCFIREDIREAFLEYDLPSEIIDQLKNRFDKQNHICVCMRQHHQYFDLKFDCFNSTVLTLIESILT